MEKRHGPFKTGRGLILGKFLPPHQGHEYLIRFALNYCHRLTVLVGTLKSEPIPGTQRFTWMKEMFPEAEVLHLTDENPQEPHEHPDFWPIWHDSIRRLVPEGPDWLFASEPYGFKLAQILGAQYVPVDQPRSIFSVSGTEIRENPMANWAFIPPTVRPYYVRRVAVVGPESTGKTVLAQRLARHFQTVWVSEYARGYIDARNQDFGYEDFEFFARGQIASEEALARQANRVLVCDSDLITTMMYADLFHGRCPEFIKHMADDRGYDLYLLTDPNTPWVDDVQRFFPQGRQDFFDRFKRELEMRKRPFTVIQGSWDDRFQQAVAAVDRLLSESRDHGQVRP